MAEMFLMADYASWISQVGVKIGLKFGQRYANNLRPRSPQPGDGRNLDEVFLKINGRIHYLWREVDQDGDVLDILVQGNRDKKAAKKFFGKLLKGLRYVAPVFITDRLKKLQCG
jgi:putative transposase